MGGTASGQVVSTLTVAKTGTGAGTVTSNPLGIACGIHCVKQYVDTTVVTLTPVPDSGSSFVGWTGCDAVSGSLCGITMTWDATITASFEGSVTLDVTRTGTGAGTITGEPGGINCGTACSAAYWPSQSAVVTLTATAAAGSEFTGWSGCPSASGVTCTVTMTAGATVSAAFAHDATVTAVKAGAGTGTVTSYPAGINCGATCSHLFDGGTALTLVAQEDPTSAFQGWTGCDNVTNTVNCNIYVSTDVTATAQFGHDAILTLSTAGTGTGAVSRSSPGIDCGTGCYMYPPGAQVTLTATPGSHNVFSGWTGCPSASGATCAVTMTADVSVTAQFATGFTVTITKTGPIGGASVYSSPGGFACGRGCAQATGTFAAGTLVVLRASTNEFSRFGWWTGDCSGVGPCILTLDADYAATATFVQAKAPRYNLAVAKTKKNAGDGVIESDDQTIHCGSTCRNSYYSGTPIVLTAAANEGSTFAGWSPASLHCPGTDPCAVTMGSAKTARAVFVGPQKLTVRKQHVRNGNGTVVSDPPGIDFGLFASHADAYYVLGTEVTLTAEADTGSEFTGWKPASLGCEGTDPCAVAMDKARTVTAVFAKPKDAAKGRREAGEEE